MSPDPENFEQLCRLVKLKRHEQPPPGYFNRFSGEVIARIRLGEGAKEADFFERILWESTWLHRVFSAFEARPVIAGAFGVAMCALLISGVVYAEKTDVQPIALIPVQESRPDAAGVRGVLAQHHPLLAQPAGMEASSTSPVSGLPSDGPLLGGFEGLPQAQATSATFTLPGRN